jgi:hypothetical protein
MSNNNLIELGGFIALVGIAIFAATAGIAILISVL